MTGLSAVRDRKLIQWLVGYAAIAWVVLQVVEMLSGMWGWSPVVSRLVFVVLCTGAGLTAVLAWFHGERGRQRVSAMELALAAAVVVVGGAGVTAVVRSSGVTGPESLPRRASASVLAVLPFEDLSPDGGRAYLGDGIAETLISSLARIDGLTVVARTSAFAFRDSGDVREIGRRLGAGSIVEGSVTQVGTRVRIRAGLVDAESGENLWAERFDDEVEEADLFELQDDVAHRIMDGLRARLGADAGSGVDRAIVRGGTRSPEAQRAYFLGVHHWTRRTTADMEEALRLFHEAIASDSSYADAWGGLALAYGLSTPQEYSVPGLTRDEALGNAIAAAGRALELDPELPSAYAALGDAAMQRGQLDRSEAWFREAIRHSPGYATAHHWLADLLMMKLDGEAALVEIQIAESLDPVAPAILVEHAEALMMLGRFEETRAQMDKTLALLPDAELVRSFFLYFTMRLGAWDEVAEHLGWLAESAGYGEEGDRLRRELANPETRTRVLLELETAGEALTLQHSRGARWELEGGNRLLGEELMRRPEMSFMVALELHGMDAALDLLEELAAGPRAQELYPPVIPALIGPEAMRTERAREVMDLVVRRY